MPALIRQSGLAELQRRLRYGPQGDEDGGIGSETRAEGLSSDAGPPLPRTSEAGSFNPPGASGNTALTPSKPGFENAAGSRSGSRSRSEGLVTVSWALSRAGTSPRAAVWGDLQAAVARGLRGRDLSDARTGRHSNVSEKATVVALECCR